MGFLDDVRTEHASATLPQSTCSVAKWLGGCEPEVQADFAQALAAEEEYAASVIYRVMRSHGYAGSVYALRRHRRNECRCGTS